MQQMKLLHESFTEALAECVAALGGAKAVGPLLRPAMKPDLAATYVRDRLNANRRELFDPDEIVGILRQARMVGCHAGMQYLARECSYAEPVPLEPQDEQAQLMRQFIDAQRQMQALATRMERIGLVRSAA